jgi:hypothetical protein
MNDRIFHVAVPVADRIDKFEAIAFDGKLWLVPHWLEAPAQKVMRPFRIIRFDNLPHRSTPGAPWGDYALTGPLPPILLERKALAKQIAGIEYRDMPEIQFEIPDNPGKSLN